MNDQTEQDLLARYDTRRRVMAIVGASSGNFVEWFDFYVYAFCALYFASAFFPSGNSTTQLMNTAAVYAIGFLMRPIGSWLFGRIADRRGRRASMMVSVLMMCGGSLIICLLPTYASIGAWAPFLLLVARMFQGLSVGGEYGTSATYMSEVAPKGRRGFFASFQYMTLICGQLCALLVCVLLQQLLSVEEMKAWGWRIPFLVGAFAGLISLYLRKSLDETSTSHSRNAKDAGTIRGVWKHKGAVLTVAGFTMGGSLSFYTFTTYMQKYLVNTAGMSAKTAGNVMTGALFVFMVMQPILGALSDRIGMRRSMICFGLLTTLCTVPLMYTLRTSSDPILACALVSAALVMVSFYTSISGLIKAEMFPVEVRAMGVGLSYAIANSIFGGTAEYLALWFKSIGSETTFYWYVTVICAISLIVSYRMRDPSKDGYLRHES
ncbi:MFS family transporter [Burkholderia sp. Bp9142]|uniref:MFS family transporter n=1 Tax=Burkholderia sp. Bp9142 TaxID=2184573 RepID=UPI000F5A048F|nr:MFS family transporter [Burkholderia sp. Bp9142]RQR26493.1 MFS transporter [Burkholderia sp. Bp9142]